MAKILIVDDERSAAMAMSVCLVDAGYQVRTAYSGGEALEIFRTDAPDLVLLENSLPDLSGLDLYRMLRTQQASCPAILVTGAGSEELAAQALREGVHDYLIKSEVLVESLPHAVSQALNRHRIQEQLERRSETLRRSEETARVLLNASNDAVLLIGADRRVLAANRAGLRLFGAGIGDRIELPAATGSAAAPDEDSPVDIVLKTGEPLRFEGPWQDRVFDISMWSIHGDSIAVLLHDITEHHELHDVLLRTKDSLERRVNERTMALEEANVRLRGEIEERNRAQESLQWELAVNSAVAELSGALIGGIDDVAALSRQVLEKAMWLTGSSRGWIAVVEPDTDYSVIFALTQPDVSMASTRASEMTVHTVPDDSLPCLLRRERDEIDPSFSNAPRQQPEWTGGRLDGENLSRCLCVPAVFGQEVVGHIELANAPRDYTQRDQEAVRQLAELLSLALNRLRTKSDRDRLERQLRQAQKMEAIGTLAGGIAHDFNNILAGIIGYTEVALAQEPDQPIRRPLTRVLEAGRRARDLVAQILSFSRQAEQERRPIPIAAAVEEAVQLLRSTIPKTIEIRVDIQTPGGIIFSEPSQVHQVIVNLCSNAAQAMRSSGGVLEIVIDDVEVDATMARAHPALQPGPHIRLTVRDTGPGIDPAIINRIFEPFFTTKHRGEGTGLGLSVVHGIVTSHGGAVVVDSRPGRGSAFRVYLPAAEEEETSPVLTTIQVAGGNERILLLDDEPVLVDLGIELLSGLGYAVTGFTSSREALEALRSDPAAFDLVITDQTMPELTGLQLATELHRSRPELPIVLCTGFSEAVTPEVTAKAGVSALLNKPAGRAEIASVVRRVLDRQ